MCKPDTTKTGTKPRRVNSHPSKHSPTPQEYNYQPPYSTTLRPPSSSSSSSNPQSHIRVRVNDSLTKNPKYRNVLFGKLSKSQVRTLQHRMLKYWSICWIAIGTNYFGYLPLWLCCIIIARSLINHNIVGHDNMHMTGEANLPMYLRLPAFGLFCAGFTPFASTYGDSLRAHRKNHHMTKAVLDRSPHDHDSVWSDLPMWQMLAHFFVSPSHVGAYEILCDMYQHPWESLRERIIVNIFHWFQLYLLYQTGNFWTILTVGHCTMWITWVVFHGLIHRPGFYQMLIEADPSGARQMPAPIELVAHLISVHAWIEIKWHDVHHSHGHAVQSFAAQELRGVPIAKMEEALADLVDEGLFADPQTGKGVSPLAQVGHKVGSRRSYLMQKGQQGGANIISS